MGRILWGIVVVILAFWALGLVFRIAGNLIHLLLVVAVIVVIFNLISGQRNRA